MRLIGTILLSVLLAVIGQIFLKKGMLVTGSVSFDWRGLLDTAKSVVTCYQVLLGLAAYALSTLLWLMALSRADLSYVYPFTALTFVLVMLASSLVFKETISSLRAVGFLLICVGIVFVSRT